MMPEARDETKYSFIAYFQLNAANNYIVTDIELGAL